MKKIIVCSLLTGHVLRVMWKVMNTHCGDTGEREVTG